MSFIWFIVALIFFVLWANKNTEQKRTNKENYQNGFRDGQQKLADALHALLKKKATNNEDIKKTIDNVRQGFDEEVQQQSQQAAVKRDSLYLEQAVESANEPEVVPETTPEPIEYREEPARPVRTKKETNERNLNILLYMASFLIVAAAAAFIATSTPPLVRLVCLWLVIIVFYSAGYILHAKVSYLRPAATAFIGTGLALIPFAGIALSQLGGIPGGWAWFITSVIGIFSYLLAALQLKSQVISYLTIAFSLSLAASTVATFSGPIVLYFVALIIASLIFHLLAHFNPRWVPDLFKLPISQTGHILTPLTLVGSLLAYDSMTLTSYQIVFWVATLYYTVLWLTERGLVYETFVRVLASASALITIYDVSNGDLTIMSSTILVLSVLQVAYSLLRVKLADDTSRWLELSWVILTTGLLVMTSMLWLGTRIPQTGLILQVAAIFAIGIGAALRFHTVYFAIPSLIASVVLPFLIGRWPGSETLTMQGITWLFLGLSVAAMVVSHFIRNHSLSVRGFIQASFWVYSLVVFVSSFGQGSSLEFIASTIGLIVIFGAASYVYKQWWIELLAVILVLPVLALTFIEIAAPSEWLTTLTIVCAAIIYALLLSVHHLLGQTTRRNLGAVAAVAVGFGLVFNYGHPTMVLQTSFYLALLYVVIGLIGRYLADSKVLKGLFSVAYAIYPFIGLLFALTLGEGWLTIALGVAAVTYWLASYLEKEATVMVFGNIAFIATVAAFWSWLNLDSEWFIIGVAWITAVVMYTASLIYTFVSVDTKRKYIHLIFTWIVLALATAIHFFASEALGYAAAATLLAIAGTIALEGKVTYKQGLVEASIYVATLALQRMVSLYAPDLNIVFYGHWWALTLLLTALWFKGPAYKTRLVLATACITIGTGSMALLEGGMYQLLFLIEHIALLVAGALLRTSWALWWGLAASVVAVLYFLRSSLFLSLLFLGLTLLAIVIWRLIRAHQKNSGN